MNAKFENEECSGEGSPKMIIKISARDRKQVTKLHWPKDVIDYASHNDNSRAYLASRC
jgi:hypothetical protein